MTDEPNNPQYAPDMIEGAPDVIWAWVDKEYDATLWNTHGDPRYTPDYATSFTRTAVSDEALAKLQARYDALLAHHASELGSVMAEVRDRALEEAANLVFDPQVAEAIRALKPQGT